MDDRCDIAVVGGGVVGAAAALALHRGGFDVRLLERGPPPSAPGADYDQRVYAMAPSSRRLLGELGVWAELPQDRLCPYRAMRIWEASPDRALTFDAADVAQNQLGWIVEQAQLLAVLWRQLPARVVRANTPVIRTDFQSPPCAGASLTLGQGSLQARLVVAAEGAGSPLREGAGIVTTERDYGQLALVAHVQTREPHRGIALQRFLPGGPLALLPLSDGRRSIVWSLPVVEAQRVLAMDDGRFCQHLASAIQFEVGAVDATTLRVPFALRLMHANDYVRDALVLVGDSAHVIHPLAGQGVNLGLADVAELLKVLGRAREDGADWAGSRVLRRYARARKAANREMLALTDGLDRAFRFRGLGVPGWLDAGLATLDRVAPAKQLLIRRALG